MDYRSQLGWWVITAVAVIATPWALFVFDEPLLGSFFYTGAWLFGLAAYARSRRETSGPEASGN